MKSILALLPILAIWLTSCTQADEADLLIPIGFTSTVEPQTRGIDYTNDNITSIGVLAYFSQGGNFNASTAMPNYMYNQEVKNNGGTWSYDPIQYWPANKNDKLSFFAYSPYVDEKQTGGGNPTISEKTTTGYPVLAYTVHEDEDSQQDLLASTPLMNCAGGNVNFTMRHALTKVTIIVKSKGKYVKEITSFSVNTAVSGELQFKSNGFDWKNLTGTHSYVPPITFPLNVTEDHSQVIANFFLLPVGTTTNKATFSISYIVRTTTGGEILRTQTVTNQALPANPSWTPGSHVSYTINLSESQATVTTESIAWGEGNSKDFHLYSPSEVKVGDYFYSDGTWSDGGLRMFCTVTGEAVYTNPLPAKTAGKDCIGIVFSTRMNPEDVERGWTHGYVAYKNINNTYEWGPGGTDTNIPNLGRASDVYNNLNGYDNTQIIKNQFENFAGYPAFSQAVNRPGATIEGTSGWFLPSMGQIWDLIENCSSTNYPTLKNNRTSTAGGIGLNAGAARNDINSFVSRVGGGVSIGRAGTMFYSSTENGGSNVYMLSYNSFSRNGIYALGKNNHNGQYLNNVICVLAF